MLVRKFLHSQGFRYTLHDKKLPGKPDIVLKKYKTIIDVRGCFWHSHEDCKYGNTVKTPSKIITSRRDSAIERDQIKVQKWKQSGWNIIIVWAECELEPRKANSIKRKINLQKIKLNLRGI